MKWYYCIECGSKHRYRTKAALLKTHPTIERYPHLIAVIERPEITCSICKKNKAIWFSEEIHNYVCGDCYGFIPKRFADRWLGDE